MSTSDRDETITDRAAIRDSDEPSERGDFPYYDLGPATSETVGALDLDAITRRATYLFPTYARRVLDEDVPALIAEVRRLRRWKAEALPVIEGLQGLGDALGLRIGEQITGPAGLDAALALTARAEAAEAGRDEALAKVAAVEALLKAGAGWLWVGEPEGWAVLVSDLRAALATGEGK